MKKNLSLILLISSTLLFSGCQGTNMGTDSTSKKESTNLDICSKLKEVNDIIPDDYLYDEIAVLPDNPGVTQCMSKFRYQGKNDSKKSISITYSEIATYEKQLIIDQEFSKMKRPDGKKYQITKNFTYKNNPGYITLSSIYNKSEPDISNLTYQYGNGVLKLGFSDHCISDDQAIELLEKYVDQLNK